MQNHWQSIGFLLVIRAVKKSSPLTRVHTFTSLYWNDKHAGKQVMYRIIYTSKTQSTAVWAVNYVLLKCNVFHFLLENSNHQTSLEKGPFSHEVAGAILVYKTINWRPCWCTEKILREFTFFSRKNFLFFQETCLAADHVTDNDL